MNKVILLGRLTKAPEIRYSQTTNSIIVNFTLAVNRKYVKEGEGRQTDFISIVSFGKTAEFVETYFKKGMQIALVGRIQTRNYDDTNGQKRYVTEVIAEEVQFAETPKRSADNILYANHPSNIEQNADTDNDIIANDDDDLPF